MFDTTTKEFKTYKNPPPPAVPPGTWQDWVEKGGEPAEPPRATTYDTTVDNEGIIWFSEVSLGTLVRLDPSTGQTMNFRPEGVVSIRGITVDPQDNLWFGDFHGHRLGKMNVKTRAVTMYKPPTPNATAYGLAYNPVDGNLWYADMNGNNITRFNPKTEKFTEFRIPTGGQPTAPSVPTRKGASGSRNTSATGLATLIRRVEKRTGSRPHDRSRAAIP